jgi:hypothetical protein
VLEADGTVGFDEVLHTTPLAVIGEPPSAVMFPPLVAVEEVIDVAVTVGNAFTVMIVVAVFVQPAAFVPVTVYVVVAVGMKLTPFVTPPLHV